MQGFEAEIMIDTALVGYVERLKASGFLHELRTYFPAVLMHY